MTAFDDRLVYLFQRFVQNNCTRDELEELSGRISADDAPVSQLMDSYYDRMAPGAGAEKVDWEQMFHRIIHQPVKAPVRKITAWRWMAAAILILLTGLGALYLLRPGEARNAPARSAPVSQDIAPGKFKAMLTLANGQRVILDSVAAGKLAQQGAASIVHKEEGLVYTDDHSNSDKPIYNSLSTAQGETYSFLLADGTKVWLDAATSIRFPAVFRGKDRAVEIVAGQAYFEVAANASKPFLVRQGKTDIQVLGTHFNVSAYEEAAVKITLLEGSVRVSGEGMGRPALLRPGQQARANGEKIQVLGDIDLDQVMAWKNGFFNFKNTDLKTIMGEISRWYAIDIRYEGKVPEIVMTGKAPRSLTLSTMFKLLKLSEVKYRIEGRRLIIAE